jgi:hypothetical protein
LTLKFHSLDEAGLMNKLSEKSFLRVLRKTVMARRSRIEKAGGH